MYWIFVSFQVAEGDIPIVASHGLVDVHFQKSPKIVFVLGFRKHGFVNIYEFSCFRAEVEAYNALDPGVRVVILKALCDIRVEVLALENLSVQPIVY